MLLHREQNQLAEMFYIMVTESSDDDRISNKGDSVNAALEVLECAIMLLS